MSMQADLINLGITDYREALALQHELAAAVAAGERPDTYPFVVDLRGVDQFRELIRLLERRGFPSRVLEKGLGRNFVAYAERVWTA